MLDVKGKSWNEKVVYDIWLNFLLFVDKKRQNIWWILKIVWMVFATETVLAILCQSLDHSDVLPISQPAPPTASDTDDDDSIDVDGVSMMALSNWLRSTPWQSIGHLNVLPNDQQRVIGSPAPAAIRKMNEKHRKKKLVGKWFQSKVFDLFTEQCSGSFQLWRVSFNHPFRLRWRWWRRRRWRSVRDTERHRAWRWRGKQCNGHWWWQRRQDLYFHIFAPELVKVLSLINS